MLVCFAGAKRASHVRSELGKGLRSSGADLLDEAVLKVNGKGRPGSTTRVERWQAR